MVKLDLERVGIANETADGIADFHAAARHSDIKMTMRYTHIGINDQAKALKQLPGSRP